MFKILIVQVLFALQQRCDYLCSLGAGPDTLEQCGMECLGFHGAVFRQDVTVLQATIRELQTRLACTQSYELPLHAEEIGSRSPLYNTTVEAIREYDLDLYRTFRAAGGSPPA